MEKGRVGEYGPTCAGKEIVANLATLRVELTQLHVGGRKRRPSARLLCRWSDLDRSPDERGGKGLKTRVAGVILW